MANKINKSTRKSQRRKSSDKRWLGGTEPSYNRRKGERRIDDRRDSK
ncbi:MAG: hypothetical protein ABIA17_02200 [Elusimicrobiota bacterium]